VRREIRRLVLLTLAPLLLPVLSPTFRLEGIPEINKSFVDSLRPRQEKMTQPKPSEVFFK
jgi:hypothetical protein